MKNQYTKKENQDKIAAAEERNKFSNSAWFFVFLRKKNVFPLSFISIRYYHFSHKKKSHLKGLDLCGKQKQKNETGRKTQISIFY